MKSFFCTVTKDEIKGKKREKRGKTREKEGNRGKKEGKRGGARLGGSRRSRRFALGRMTESDYISVPELLKRNKDNPLIKSLIEYILYEVIVLESIEYMSGLLRLKDELDDAYSYSSNFSINNAADISDNPVFKNYFVSRTEGKRPPAMKRLTGEYQIKKNLGLPPGFDLTKPDFRILKNITG